MRVRKVFLNDKQSIINRLEKDKAIIGTCWVWLGHLNNKGYGELRIGEKFYKTHRLSLYIYGDLDINNSEEHALHKLECERRDCFNPEHLYKGTNKDNMHDLSVKIQATPNYPCGHPRTEENTRRSRKTINCRKCKIQKSIIYRTGGHLKEEKEITGPKRVY